MLVVHVFKLLTGNPADKQKENCGKASGKLRKKRWGWGFGKRPKAVWVQKLKKKKKGDIRSALCQTITLHVQTQTNASSNVRHGVF